MYNMQLIVMLITFDHSYNAQLILKCFMLHLFVMKYKRSHYLSMMYFTLTSIIEFNVELLLCTKRKLQLYFI